LMAFTPLLDVWLGQILGVSKNLINATRPAMIIMILWSALIGHRRFHQGILIRSGHTRPVSHGTMIRIVVSAGIAMALGVLSQLPGAVIGGYALIFAVAAETIYIYYISRPDVQALQPTTQNPPLTTFAAMKFHIPLAMTSLMTLLMRPVVERGLASTSSAEKALAAWPVIYAILLLMRSGGMAWQEVVITLSKNPDSEDALRRFTWSLGLTLTGLMILVGWTPLIDIYIDDILKVPESLHALVVLGTRAAFLIPLFTALQSYLRAELMLTDTTNPIYQGMFLSLILTAGCLWAGLEMQMSGILTASIALTIGTFAELVYLWVVTKKAAMLRLSIQRG
ncbi:MAG: hypothetical protein K8I82_04395, partial [Anaerolineae bacterium]|nr:hypothetical protein [Anaerolineae bacterium]